MSHATFLVLALAAAALFALSPRQSATQPAPQAPVPPVLCFTMNSIDGAPIDLKSYLGKVILFVNTASECGLTPQYEQLQALHDKYADQGLVILGFPCNDFGQQEPGSDSDIKSYCSGTYNVTFPLFSKISVKPGKDQSPLYKFLTEKQSNPRFAGDIEWNFAKFLISRDGQVVNRFHPKIKPDADDVIKAIETELNTNPKPSSQIG